MSRAFRSRESSLRSHLFMRARSNANIGLIAVVAACLAAGGVNGVIAATPPEATKEQIQFFENKIRPILTDNCYKCHSHEAPKLKGGLSVEFHETLLKGGETGPAIVPGDPDKSLLIKAVRYTDPDLQMPPKDKKLSDEQIQDLVLWVKMGAPDPRTTNSVAFASALVKTDRNHWAFKPVVNPPVPEVKEEDKAWVSTPVDSFIA